MNLKELSQILNLSQTTVSRALNGYPEVNEGTRQRVIEAAREHGYAPNAAARRLATGKANAIGCVVLSDGEGMRPQFMEFLAGVAERAAVDGLDVVLASASVADEDAAYRRLASHGQVDGVFLFAPDRGDERIELLNELDLPFLVFGRAPGVELDHPVVDFGTPRAFHSAARLLLQLGHRDIVLLNGPRTKGASRHRENGVRRAMNEANIDWPAQRVVYGDASEPFGYEAASRMLDSDARPTAFICANLFAAMGVERAASERELLIGADVSIVAQDDGFSYLDPETFWAPMTTMRAPLRAAGRRVAERLNHRIKGLEKEPKTETLPIELVVRASIGPPRG